MKKLAKIIKIGSVFFLVILLALLGLSQYFQNFETKTQIIVVPKNEMVSENYQKTLENIIQIAQTSDFKKKLFNSVEKDIFKKDSNFNYTITQEGNSGVLNFKGQSSNQNLSQSVSRNAAILAGYEVSRFYNIKQELNFIIIENGIPIKKTFPIQWIVGVILGIILIVLIYSFAKKKFDLKWKNISLSDVPDWKKWMPKASEVSEKKPLPDFLSMMKKKKKPQPKTEVEFPYVFVKKEKKKEAKTKEKKEALPSQEKKASAPGNLPIAPDSIMQMFGAVKNGGYKIPDKNESEKKDEEKTTLYREATPEEVKERLNKLLGGM